MTEPAPADPTADPEPPPRALAQGVGTVFQYAGVLLFLAMSFTCCGSGLLSREWATQEWFSTTGLRLEPHGPPVYSAARAVTVCLFAGVFFGVALAGVGLGLQAERPSAAMAGLALTHFAAVFWVAHVVFALRYLDSIVLLVIPCFLGCLFILLAATSIYAWRDMRANPPPRGHEVLPAGYKVPYSHYHVDPPEVRLAAELEQRRERLAVQQKELEMLEARLKRRMAEKERE